MKSVVKVRNLMIGTGRPKVCVSLTGTTTEEVLQQAKWYSEQKCDLMEWRMDYHQEVEKLECMKETAGRLREVLGDRVLLATFRSQKEGGEREISASYYEALNRTMIETGEIDLVDIELAMEEKMARKLVQIAHSHQVKVVMSNHDFEKTPSEEVIITRLCKMQEWGADLLKIAVMPNSPDDVLTLLGATRKMNTLYAVQPVVTMSMGKLGMISRLTGELFGSAVTFGAGKRGDEMKVNGSEGQGSAPGQIPLDELDSLLALFHITGEV